MQALLHDDTDESVKLRKRHDCEGAVLSKLSVCSEALRWADAQLASLIPLQSPGAMQNTVSRKVYLSHDTMACKPPLQA